MKKTLFIILLLTLSFFTAVHAQIISTIAGTYFSGTHFGDGGPATNAGLVSPFGTAVDSRGNVYVSEYSNYVRKIDHKGIITTVAGSGTAGPLGDNGPATAAFLDVITDLAMDASDNLYIVDHGNSRIRKVDKAGIITTIAGGGLLLGDGLPATVAKLDNLNGITIDPSGTIYLAMNTIVRKVNSAGIITTIAGNGTSGYSGDGGTAIFATLQGGYDVALDKVGNLYVTDQYANTIREITTSGLITTIAGTAAAPGSYSGDGGPASAAKLLTPWGIVADASDNIIFCDARNNVVRKISSTTGIITTVAGNTSSGYAGDGFPATAADCGSTNLAVDCGNNLFLAGSRHHLRKVTYTYSPVFVSANDSLVVCENAKPVSIDTLLPATDKNVPLSLDWSMDVPPVHGTIGGAIYSATTTGSILTPDGFTYTPAPDYAGIDSFTMMVAYCSQVADWRTVHVRVKPGPVVAQITGTDTVCRWRTITLSNATPDGVWTTTNEAAAVDAGGSVTAGAVAATDTVGYTVTALGCSTTATYVIKVIDCVTGINELPYSAAAIKVYPNPAGRMIHVDGLQGVAHYRLLTIIGSIAAEGTLTAGNNEIAADALANGLYMLEITDPASGVVVTKKVVKK